MPEHDREERRVQVSLRSYSLSSCHWLLTRVALSLFPLQPHDVQEVQV